MLIDTSLVVRTNTKYQPCTDANTWLDISIGKDPVSYTLSISRYSNSSSTNRLFGKS